MSLDLLKNVAVRITVDDGAKKSVGSGIITCNSKKCYFIITAEHCIYGKRGERFTNIDISNIKVEYKKLNSDVFTCLNVFEIVYSDTDNDITVLSVKMDKSNLESILYSSILSESDCKNLAFRGFPKWLSTNDEAKTFNCKIEENDNSTFLIKSDEIKDPTFSKAIEETSSGLSGSGVYEVKNGKIFLIGIITDLRDSKGTFGHMKCSKLNNVFILHDYEVHPLSNSAQQLFFQSEEADKKNIASKIAALKATSNDRFDNLERKCKVLYNLNDVEEMIDEILTDFFLAEIKLKKIGKLNGFIQSEFDEVQAMLSKRVNKTFRNQQVKNKKEAQEIYSKVMDLFIQFMDMTTNKPELSPSNIESLGDKAVNELLLNCDLNFVKHD